MLDLIAENLSTVIVGAVLAALLTLAVLKMIKDSRSGKGSCSGCPYSSGCATYKNIKECRKNEENN